MQQILYPFSIFVHGHHISCFLLFITPNCVFIENYMLNNSLLHEIILKCLNHLFTYSNFIKYFTMMIWLVVYIGDFRCQQRLDERIFCKLIWKHDWEFWTRIDADFLRNVACPHKCDEISKSEWCWHFPIDRTGWSTLRSTLPLSPEVLMTIWLPDVLNSMVSSKDAIFLMYFWSTY